MYQDVQIPIPASFPGLTRKTINGTTYIYYNWGRAAVPGKTYTAPKNTCVGKLVPGTEDLMFPNESYAKFFPNGFVEDNRRAEAEAARDAARKEAAEKARQLTEEAKAKAEEREQDRLALLRMMELCRSLYRSVCVSEQEIRNLKQRVRNLGQRVPSDFPVLSDHLPEVPASWLE